MKKVHEKEKVPAKQTLLPKTLLAAGAAGMGAGLAYLLDAQNGKRRRAQLRDRGFHLMREAAEAMERTASDLGGRSHALVPRLKRLFKLEIVDDRILVERVRSQMGHHVSHPHALKVEARDGTVTLRGPIPSGEMEVLLNRVRRISGVRALRSRLEPQDRAASRSETDAPTRAR